MIEEISKYVGHEKRKWIKQTVLWKLLKTSFYLPVWMFSLKTFFRGEDRNKKTVFILVNKLSNGGAQRVATVLASELTKKYHVVLINSRLLKSYYPVSPQVELVCVPWGLWDFETIDRFTAVYMKAIKRRRNVYATISFLYISNKLNVLSKIPSEKVICCERNNPTRNEDNKRLEEIQRLYETADHVVFQSDSIRDLFSEKVKRHSTILPNPVGVTCIRSSAPEHRIVNCGRLAAQKNQALLIRAFSRFHTLHPEYTLSIHGEGELRVPLENLISDLNLEDVVILEGWSPKVQEEISDAEIFILSSDYEGLSNALLEAMMMGFPCISTDCEGSREVIKDGENGLLVPCGDETALLAAMLKLAEQVSFREKLGKKAANTAKLFRKEKAVAEWAEMIENA